MPTECSGCGKVIPKDDVQHISVYPGRREPVCNIDCAIEIAKRDVHNYNTTIKALETRIEKLTYYKYHPEELDKDNGW